VDTPRPIVMPSFTKRQVLRLGFGLGVSAVPRLAIGKPKAAGSEEEGDTIHIPPKIEWEKIAELPPIHGMAKHPGLAGAYAGVHQGALIIAGGTNYPVGKPWNGARRSWWPDIYVLERTQAPDFSSIYTWVPAQSELTEPLAYGASVSIPDGVLCMGGASVDVVHSECFVLQWNKSERKVERVEFPSLPQPICCHAAVLLKGIVYVLGGTSRMPNGRPTNQFYCLDLAKKGTPEFTWKALTPWDGPGRVFPIAAASLEGDVESLYLCGGRDTGNDPDFLTDLHKFDPIKRDWSILGDVVDPRGHPASVMAAPAFHVPPHHLVVVSGTDQDLMKMLEGNTRDLKELDDREKADRLRYNQLLLEKYPGYTRTVLGYDAAIGEWNHIGNFPGEACLTTPAVNWDGLMIIPSGETGPGTRSPIIWAATIRKKPQVVVEDEESPAPK
jgi:solute:Na+ symporter, SSS family